MSKKPELTPDEKIETWIKSDGETEIRLNSNPATIEKAKELGWTRKRGPKKQSEK